MIETPQESQGVIRGGADVPGTSILQETSARTSFQGQNVRKEGFPDPQDVLTLISTMYLKSIKPSTQEEFNAFIVYSYFEKGCRKKRARDNPERQYGI